MPKKKPKLPTLIAINHDDYHAKHIGRTADGRQFFLTTPFIAAYPPPTPGNEFIALYLFDAKGKFLEARIDELGPRESLNKTRARALYNQRLAELGDITFTRIEIAPFSIKKFNTEFGLILQPPDDEIEDWTATVEPGNVMAFFPPWDSGDYDT